MHHETQITVRFGETDLLGHVNNVSYFTYLEHARIQFFKELSTEDIKDAWRFILASVKCDFLAQAYFDQTLTITTTVSRIGNKSFDLKQRIFDSKTGEPVAEGHSTIVYFDFQEQKSLPLIKELRERLEQYASPGATAQ